MHKNNAVAAVEAAQSEKHNQNVSVDFDYILLSNASGWLYEFIGRSSNFIDFHDIVVLAKHVADRAAVTHRWISRCLEQT